jgi:hypothetical protein
VPGRDRQPRRGERSPVIHLDAVIACRTNQLAEFALHGAANAVWLLERQIFEQRLGFRHPVVHHEADHILIVLAHLPRPLVVDPFHKVISLTMHDLVIRGATIVDGTGAPASSGDIAIDGDNVTEVGGTAGSARRELDGDGLIAAPRLGRRAHALRRSSHLGPRGDTVELAWRHDRRDGQLRCRVRAGAAGR